jgi:hypothetical protein
MSFAIEACAKFRDVIRQRHVLLLDLLSVSSSMDRQPADFVTGAFWYAAVPRNLWTPDERDILGARSWNPR